MAASLTQELSGCFEKVGKLFQLDAALLSIETKQNLWAVLVSALLLVGAGLAAMFGMAFLLSAIVLFIIQLGFAPSMSALVVAVALFLVAALLALIGLSRMRHWSLHAPIVR